MNATQLIKKYFIDPIDRQQTNVGIEIELPLVSLQNTAVELAFTRKLARHIQRLGFTSKRSTLDGDTCEWVNENGDILSFETTWNTLELSMKKSIALPEIAKWFYPLLLSLQKFCLDNGYYLCGRGINPNCANINTTPLRTPILLAKSNYLSQYTKHHDGEVFHAICASVQTHIDAVSAEQYIERLNLLRRAYVFDALFFANTMPPSDEFVQSNSALRDINVDTICFRDELWRNCGAPNVLAPLGKINNTEELSRYLMDLKLFILPDADGFSPSQPISFETYCEQTGNGEAALRCFRSLEPVALTQKGTLELRSICTQPLDMLFAPSAFYLGLVENHFMAKGKIDYIYNHYFPENTPLEVRDKLMKRSNESLRQQLKGEGIGLLNIAINGLKNRAFGEEEFLLPLKEKLQAEEYLLPALYNDEDAALQMKRQMDIIRRKYQ